MGKITKYKKKLVDKWFAAIPEKCFTVEGNEVICTTCEKKVTCDKKFQLQQHMATAQHKRSKGITNKKDETQDSSGSTSSNEFKMDLCDALVAGNIPWNVLNNETFSHFLQKYTGQQIPDESSLKKTYLDKCYQKS